MKLPSPTSLASSKPIMKTCYGSESLAQGTYKIGVSSLFQVLQALIYGLVLIMTPTEFWENSSFPLPTHENKEELRETLLFAGLLSIAVGLVLGVVTLLLFYAYYSNYRFFLLPWVAYEATYVVMLLYYAAALSPHMSVLSAVITTLALVLIIMKIYTIIVVLSFFQLLSTMGQEGDASELNLLIGNTRTTPALTA